MGKKKKGLANPSGLKAFDADEKLLLRVIIETPKGSRNKFAFNEQERIFELRKYCPQGWGFHTISTKAEDGDPVDVLVLMDEPAFAGFLELPADRRH